MSGAGTNQRRLESAQALDVRRRKRETLQEKSARANAVAGRLAQLYPEVVCPLIHRNTFELLVAVILSAQCTDAAVNKVTPALFRRFPDPTSLSRASTTEIEPLIRTLGLYRAKAKSLQRCASQLVDEFDGKVPATMEQLTRLSGVGRKTANVILGHAFDTPGIAVDTHCKRLSRRLGFTRQQDPTKIERDLGRLFPPREWTGLLIVSLFTVAGYVTHAGRRARSARSAVCVRRALLEMAHISNRPTIRGLRLQANARLRNLLIAQVEIGRPWPGLPMVLVSLELEGNFEL